MSLRCRREREPVLLLVICGQTPNRLKGLSFLLSIMLLPSLIDLCLCSHAVLLIACSGQTS